MIRKLALCLLVLSFTTSVYAQESGYISVEDGGITIITAVLAIVLGGAQGLGVQPVTQLLKWLAEKLGWKLSANIILFVVATVFTILYWLAQRLGFEVQFESISQYLNDVIPLLLQLFASMWGAKKIYTVARANDIPLFGYQRTE